VLICIFEILNVIFVLEFRILLLLKNILSVFFVHMFKNVAEAASVDAINGS